MRVLNPQHGVNEQQRCRETQPTLGIRTQRNTSQHRETDWDKGLYRGALGQEAAILNCLVITAAQLSDPRSHFDPAIPKWKRENRNIYFWNFILGRHFLRILTFREKKEPRVGLESKTTPCCSHIIHLFYCNRYHLFFHNQLKHASLWINWLDGDGRRDFFSIRLGFGWESSWLTRVLLWSLSLLPSNL